MKKLSLFVFIILGIGYFGSNAEAIQKEIPSKIITGKDYLRILC